VFETLLLSLSFYLGKTGRASWSGLALGLAFFDPRLAVVALPLFLTYNKIRIMPAIRALLGILALSNLPLLYPEMGSSFLKNGLQHRDNHGSLSIRGHTSSRSRVSQLHQLSPDQNRSEPNLQKDEVGKDSR